MKAVTLSLLFMVSAALTAAHAQDLLFENSDFESGTLKNWTAQGDAFANQPTRGDNPAKRGRESAKQQGEFWIGTFENYDGQQGEPGDIRSDTPTGSLTSTEFTIAKRYISFRVGAGNLPDQVGVKLVVDGSDHLMSSGFDSETMEQVSFDAQNLVGKRAKIVIFDDASGGWGHINADDFRATDEPAPGPSMEFKFTEGISASAYPDTGYDQPLRPQFHFSSKKNWLNDPNGMVFDGEKYHLFFQHNPMGTAWGNMTWGHATSTDMIHWEQLDHALLPYEVDRREGTIFSGTAVVDHNNSLGVQTGDQKTLVAFYTFANRPLFYQAMAYSTDAGDTWTYHNEGRAVVDNQGFDSGERDPKVLWHEDSKQWSMALWVQQKSDDKPGIVRFFTSDNLKDWKLSSELHRDWVFECMDLVELPLDGDENNKKWLLYDASFEYEIGDFDGEKFSSDKQALKHQGGNYYAAQTFNDSPDGRSVIIGWMRGGPNSAEAYGLPFNQQMSFPAEMTLRTTKDGARLFLWPIKEIGSLVAKTHSWKALTPEAATAELAKLPNLDLIDAEIDLSPGDAEEVRFDLGKLRLRFNSERNFLECWQPGENDNEPRWSSLCGPLEPRDGRVKFRLLVDRLSVEAFAFDGEMTGTMYYDPRLGSENSAISGDGAIVNALEIRELKSAW